MSETNPSGWDSPQLFVLRGLPPPPGFNHSYEPITRRGRDASGRYRAWTSFGMTDAAKAWVLHCADALRSAMRSANLPSLHVPAYDKRRDGYVLKPDSTRRFTVWAYYRLTTVQQDVDAPVKLLLDTALEDAMGVSDRFAIFQAGTKRLCAHKGQRSAKGNKILEKAQMDVVIDVQPMTGAGQTEGGFKDGWNQAQAAIEQVVLTQIFGMDPEVAL